MKGDKQLKIAVLIWLVTASILFYFRVSAEPEALEWSGIIILGIFFYPVSGILMALSLGIWNLILMIASGNLNPSEVGVFANKDDWSNKEILFHFILGWPIGCMIMYGILKGFGII